MTKLSNFDLINRSVCDCKFNGYSHEINAYFLVPNDTIYHGTEFEKFDRDFYF